MSDPTRSQLGEEQREWLFGGLDRSNAAWRILANSSVLGRTWAPGISDELRPNLHALKLISADGGPDPDQWDGYPNEREALLGRIDSRNSVVLSGDVHVAMAIQLERRTGSIAAEKQLMDLLPNIRWCDMDSHGYMVVDVTPERVRVEWWFVDAVLARTPGERLGAAMEVRAGSQEIVPAT